MIEFEILKPRSIAEGHRTIFQLRKDLERLQQENEALKKEVYELKNRRD